MSKVISKNAKTYLESMKNNIIIAKMCQKSTKSFYKGD